MSEYSRPRDINVNKRIFWCLLMMVKATNKELGQLDTPATVNKLAEQILSAYIEEHAPGLLELYKEREEIEERAVESLMSKELTEIPL